MITNMIFLSILTQKEKNTNHMTSFLDVLASLETTQVIKWASNSFSKVSKNFIVPKEAKKFSKVPQKWPKVRQLCKQLHKNPVNIVQKCQHCLKLQNLPQIAKCKFVSFTCWSFAALKAHLWRFRACWSCDRSPKAGSCYQQILRKCLIT